MSLSCQISFFVSRSLGTVYKIMTKRQDPRVTLSDPLYQIATVKLRINKFKGTRHYYLLQPKFIIAKIQKNVWGLKVTFIGVRFPLVVGPLERGSTVVAFFILNCVQQKYHDKVDRFVFPLMSSESDKTGIATVCNKNIMIRLTDLFFLS